MAQFPPPDPATQGILGIQQPIWHAADENLGVPTSVYSCTLVSDGTVAEVRVYALGQENPEVLAKYRLASQPRHIHEDRE